MEIPTLHRGNYSFSNPELLAGERVDVGSVALQPVDVLYRPTVQDVVLQLVRSTVSRCGGVTVVVQLAGSTVQS